MNQETESSELNALTDYFNVHLQHLKQVRKSIYWIDLTLTALVFWTCFCLALISSHSLIVEFLLIIAGACALYRGFSFLHEIVHHPVQLKNIRIAWDILFGLPFLYPSCLYQSHLDHHRTEMYGTRNDPEYIVIEKNWKSIVFSFCIGLVIPITLVIRSFIFPFTFLSRTIKEKFDEKSSHFSINPDYRGKPHKDEVKKVLQNENIVCSIIFYVAIFLLFFGVISFRLIVLWYAVVAIATIINNIRFLFITHGYESFASRSRMEQFTDSVNSDSNKLWTLIVAPVGLRYHALHHLLPSVPYHALRELNREMMKQFPDSVLYQKTLIKKGIFH